MKKSAGLHASQFATTESIRNRCRYVLDTLGMSVETFTSQAYVFEQRYVVDMENSNATKEKNESTKPKDKEQRTPRHKAYSSEDDLRRIFYRPAELSMSIILRFINAANEIMRERNTGESPYSEHITRELEDTLEYIKSYAVFHMTKMGDLDFRHSNIQTTLIEEVMSKPELDIFDKFFNGFVILERAVDCSRYELLLSLGLSNNKADLLKNLAENLRENALTSNEAEINQVRELFHFICKMNIYETMRFDVKTDIRKIKESVTAKINKFRKENPDKDFLDLYNAFMIFIDPFNLMFILLDMLNPNRQALSIEIG